MSKKVGKQGLIIRSQGREIISNIINFMKKEADEGVTIPLKNYRERVLAATGVSKYTFQKISKEAQKVEWGGPSTSFQSPKKIRNTKKRKLDRTSPDQIKSIREIIYDFYVLEKRLPT
ncbi:uncharacterized protein LOC130450600 [Diorhabda sublineata]|uniref:uncharacterized protein LOC130450600 n=1 Tax=Diorhabda sublineata TaxID=1163346 RepID=UPI0024E139AD|nr:uncharacterized protein LOC130450600 [Diorhabda sublineata]